VGPTETLLGEAWEHFDSTLGETVKDLIILSPCFYPTPAPSSLMAASCLKNGLDVVIYGVGEEFIPHGAHAQVVRLLEVMEREKLAETALVTDCRDVLFLAGEDEILGKAGAFNAPVVMSTEINCWPSDPEVVKYFFGSSPHGYDYVNAGQFIGSWEYVKHCLRHLIHKYRTNHTGLDNSQAWWPYAIMRGELNVALDRECEIFQTMTGGADSHLVRDRLEAGPPRRVFNIRTNSLPCSVHFNGNPNTNEPHAQLFHEIFE